MIAEPQPLHARRRSRLVPGNRPSDAIHTLYAQLEARAAAEGLVLIPTGLSNIERLPRVELGPETTQHDLDEFVAIVVHLGIRALYVPEGLAHIRHATDAPDTFAPEGPSTLRIECLHGGVLHVWTHTEC